MKKRLFPALAVAVLLVAAAARAALIEIYLKKATPEAVGRGQVEIDPAPYVPSDRLLTVDVYRARKGAVYSVWIIDAWTGKKSPAGITGLNHFRTDAAGYGHYTDHTTEYILGWNTLEVAWHPDGDPSNTGDMVVEFRAKLYE